jgi:hypothetical protein
MIDNFVRIFKENQEFNFIQVMSLGLVDIKIVDEVIDNAKILMKYSEYFTQMLRILLSTSISTDKGVIELNNRAQLIADNINYLAGNHETLTINGSHPEYLVFFASCLGTEKEVSQEMLSELVEKLENLDFNIKYQLLERFSKTKLSYKNGEITENHFPTLTLEILENTAQLQEIIDQSNPYEISYTEETKYNEVNFNAMANAKIDLSSFEDKYNITLPEELKDKTYAQIKKEILNDKSILQDFSLEAIHSLVSILIRSTSKNGKEIPKITKLLFNPNKDISEQLNEIEVNNINLDYLLKTYVDPAQINNFLDNLNFPHNILSQVIIYLKGLDHNSLTEKNYSIVKLLKNAPNEVIIKHFSSFKIITDAFLKYDIAIDLAAAYKLIQRIAEAGYNDESVKRIINYCIDNKDYSIIDILTKISGRADHINKIIDWITNLSIKDINKINDVLGSNIRKLLEGKEIEKLEIISKIILNLEDNIDSKQYQKIISRIMERDIEYAKLLKSYLLSPENQLLQKEITKIVFDNLDQLENAQVIFSNYNLERFDYSENRILSLVKKIIFKNNNSSELDSHDQLDIIESYESIIGRSKSYKYLNSNQLHDRSIELKHSRMLYKDNYQSEVRNIDLEFIAISIEMLYRETGKFPRDTQLISVISNMLRDEHVIDEIATSQGKSITTALLASYLWFVGQTIDVVSSSRDLASRDLSEFSGFYKSLGIETGKNIILASSEYNEYIKFGVNYAVASDLALFRSNREFYKNTHDVSLNADVSLICDEADSVLTSEVNYKLAVDLLKTNQAETRVLFEYILEFTETDIIKNQEISLSIKNLELYLHHQFQKYVTSYKYPITLTQAEELKGSSDFEARKLYNLYKALKKCNKDQDSLFEKLIKSAIYAKDLTEGIDYVILQSDIDNLDKFIKATPIIKDQISKGTMFGDGVQAFLHLLIERAYPELEYRFDISPSSVTIFNVSPKNFFDYYRLTGVKIIGLTATAMETEEFRVNNKMLTFSVPKYKEDKKIIREEEVEDSYNQNLRLLEILGKQVIGQPIIIFAKTTKDAEEVFALVTHYSSHGRNYNLPNIQLFSASAKDTAELDMILENSGKNNYITITTPMLGRGTDFFTSYKQGFLSINLCTDLTLSGLIQIYGRVGRNGEEGNVISLFNKEIFVTDLDEYMDNKSTLEMSMRTKHQPLTDILKFFNNANQENTIGAIQTSEFITKAWSKLIANNQGTKSYAELRADLVELVKLEYPVISRKLDDYLQRVDSGTPDQNGADKHSLSLQYYTDYVEQDFIEYNKINTENFVSANDDYYWNNIKYLSRHTSIDNVIIPYRYNILIEVYNYIFKIDPETSLYKLFYNDLYKGQAIVMATHAFTIERTSFKFDSQYYEVIDQRAATKEITNDKTLFFIEGNKIFAQVNSKSALEIKIAYIIKDGIPFDLYQKILTTKEIDPQEYNVMHSFMINVGYLNHDYINGAGSLSDLMVPELKKSFNAYKTLFKSEEVHKVANIIDNLENIVRIDTSKIEYNKYQAIEITTKVDSTSSHAESILTDGKFLFWINRGASSLEPGINLFKIIRNIDEVRETLEWLKVAHSQTETRAKIYSLLREEGSNDIPEHVLIPMSPQKIGNCGWVQVKGMVKASALVGRIGEFEELPDVNSQEWQKALKDSNDIYKDFTSYDRIKRAEAIVYTIDEAFEPEFLSYEEQVEIDNRRESLHNPITNEVLERVTNKLIETKGKYEETIYERQYHKLVDIMQLELAVDSPMGESLQRIYGNREEVKLLLYNFQSNKMNEFSNLDLIYQKIVEGRIDFAPIQDSLFNKVMNIISEESYKFQNLYDFTDVLQESTKDCIRQRDILLEECIINDITLVGNICSNDVITFYNNIE